MNGGIEFGNSMGGKPPDRGKAGEEHLPQTDEIQAQPNVSGGEALGPRAFAGAEPAIEPAPTDGAGGGGERKPPRLHQVGSPEPPKEGPPPPTKEGAEIERQRVETDGIRAKNEGIRSATRIDEREASSEIDLDEKKVTSEIQNNDKRVDAEVEGIKVNTDETRKERIFFRRMIASGVVLSVVSPIVAGLTGEPWFFTGNGMGVLLAAGSMRRLSVLASSQRQRQCLLRRKPKERRAGGEEEK